MKKIIYAAVFALAIFTTTNIKAQDNWTHGKKGIYSVGLGASQVIFLGPNYYYGRTGNIGLSLNVSGEYKVWDWIGAGFQTGLDFFWANYTYYGYRYRGGRAAIAIPIGGKVNAHIMDAAGLDIADKLDVYAGINIGGGPSFSTYPGGGASGFIYAGPQVGARYWIGNIAIFGELGWGATIANVGVTF